MAQKSSLMEFSVCQFFQDGSCEYVKRYVGAEDTISGFRFYTSNVAARIGLTVRVIITDGGADMGAT